MIDTVVQATWDRAKERLRAEMGERLFEVWFSRTSLLGLNRGVLTIGVPNLFIREWIDEHYGATLRQMVSEEVGASLRVSLKVDPDLFREHRRERRREEDSVDEPGAGAEDKGFDRFLLLPGCKLAADAVRLTASGGKPDLSPLLVYGPEGTGKSHLASAAALVAPRGSRLYRVTGEDFARRFAWNMKTRKLDRFRAEVGSADLFILDDVQDLAGKEATQRELTGLLQDLRARGGRVIVFSNIHPHQLSGLDASLSSILLSGMAAELVAPEKAEQAQILRAILSGSRRAIPGEVIDAVMERGGGSVKRLDRLVRKVYAFAGLTGEPVDGAFLDRHLEEIAGPVDPAARRRETIFQVVEDHFGVDREALLSKRKTQSLAVPRAMAVMLLREHGGLTFKEIGAVLGERSHTSVYLMFKKHSPAIAADPALAGVLREAGRRLLSVV